MLLKSPEGLGAPLSWLIEVTVIGSRGRHRDTYGESVTICSPGRVSTQSVTRLPLSCALTPSPAARNRDRTSLHGGRALAVHAAVCSRRSAGDVVA